MTERISSICHAAAVSQGVHMQSSGTREREWERYFGILS